MSEFYLVSSLFVIMNSIVSCVTMMQFVHLFLLYPILCLMYWQAALCHREMIRYLVGIDTLCTMALTVMQARLYLTFSKLTHCTEVNCRALQKCRCFLFCL